MQSGSKLPHSKAVDSAGNAYVRRFTESTDFPTTAGAFDTTHGGYGDVFMAKLRCERVTGEDEREVEEFVEGEVQPEVKPDLVPPDMEDELVLGEESTPSNFEQAFVIM